MQKRFIRFTFIVLFLGFLITSCKERCEKPTLPPPVKVSVIEVSLSDVGVERDYTGTVSSSESANVSFNVAGTITALYAKEGQKVSKGQLLGKIREGEYLNAYNIAMAKLAEAQDGYDRLKKLHDANALPDVKWVEIQQELKQAQNMVEIAKRTLDNTELHSPVAGTVARKYVDVGQTVMPVEPVFEIVSINDLTMDISVGEKEIGNFEIGERALIDIEAAGLKDIEGKINQKSIGADPLTRSYTVKVAISNSNGKIFPGMMGNVVFPKKVDNDSTHTNVTLPAQSVLLNHDNRWFVWVVKDSVAQQRFVTVNELVPNGITVETGLQPGDMVIVEGIRKVGSGTKVDPIIK